MALTDAPAGTVVTRLARLAEFRATLGWDAPPAAAPPCAPDPEPFFRYDLSQELSPCGTRLEVRGVVRALTGRGMGVALGRVMRAVGDAAAVSGAVLEMRARRRPARTVYSGLAQALARDLWGAGFSVRFAPCWEVVPGGEVLLGCGGEEERLREFLAGHPSWRLA